MRDERLVELEERPEGRKRWTAQPFKPPPPFLAFNLDFISSHTSPTCRDSFRLGRPSHMVLHLSLGLTSALLSLRIYKFPDL